MVAMRTLFTLPLTALSDCATGDHHWTRTGQAGVATCGRCGSLAYCLFCCPTIPPGSHLHPCKWHRYSPAKLVDVTRPISAMSVGDTTV